MEAPAENQLVVRVGHVLLVEQEGLRILRIESVIRTDPHFDGESIRRREARRIGSTCKMSRVGNGPTRLREQRTTELARLVEFRSLQCEIMTVRRNILQRVRIIEIPQRYDVFAGGVLAGVRFVP